MRLRSPLWTVKRKSKLAYKLELLMQFRSQTGSLHRIVLTIATKLHFGSERNHKTPLNIINRAEKWPVNRKKKFCHKIKSYFLFANEIHEKFVLFLNVKSKVLRKKEQL